jgi:hypothetical protein
MEEPTDGGNDNGGRDTVPCELLGMSGYITKDDRLSDVASLLPDLEPADARQSPEWFKPEYGNPVWRNGDSVAYFLSTAETDGEITGVSLLVVKRGEVINKTEVEVWGHNHLYAASTEETRSFAYIKEITLADMVKAHEDNAKATAYAEARVKAGKPLPWYKRALEWSYRHGF